MSRPIAKVSPKFLKEDDQDSIRKARSPVDRPFRKPYWQSERRVLAERNLIILLLRTYSKASERQDIKAIGR